MKTKHGAVETFITIVAVAVFCTLITCFLADIFLGEKMENDQTLEFELDKVLTMEKVEEILQIIDSAGAEMIELRILNGDKIEYRIRFQKKEGK